MDKFISDLVLEYHVAFHHAFWIAGIILSWVALSGAIRFSIAIYRRKKGIYTPAASQMEDH
ncbi:MAG TPA: hypothetical protein PK544_08665 [Spirochaetota bacterium]|nr:hypothetical protein [Spirochaetota bacterium]HPQ53795.1 hypothetical protein [Spirochaetota bacterium]